MSRYFYFWCVRCPTRITVETEVPASSQYPDPEYSFAAAECVAAYRARPPVPNDDGLESADLCPACGSQLWDLDELLARGIVPYHENHESSKLHAAWRKEEATDGP